MTYAKRKHSILSNNINLTTSNICSLFSVSPICCYQSLSPQIDYFHFYPFQEYIISQSLSLDRFFPFLSLLGIYYFLFLSMKPSVQVTPQIISFYEYQSLLGLIALFDVQYEYQTLDHFFFILSWYQLNYSQWKLPSITRY